MNTVNRSIDEYTWQSLQDYIERLLAGLLDTLARIKADTSPDHLDRVEEMAQRKLEALNKSLLLVVEMRRREKVRLVVPIMSIGMIRLRCRQWGGSRTRLTDFAWVAPVGEETYRLVRLGFKKTGEYGELETFEGDLQQTAEKIEELVDEVCGEDA
jgi:hypothetical protein